MVMPLNQLITQAQVQTPISALKLDSRRVQPGDLFLAIAGTQHDGRTHIADALARGAAAVAYEPVGAPAIAATDAVLVPVEHLAAKLSEIAACFYGAPSQAMAAIGITGTNGKTSVSQLLAQALDQLGKCCAVVGTLGNGFYGALSDTLHTTPDPITVQSTLAQLLEQGAEAVAMEVSSHGLEQYRVAAVAFEVAVFTNLSRDHLDYHHTMQAYGAAKAKLFAMESVKYRVINLDDGFGVELAAMPHRTPVLGYSIDNPQAQLYCQNVCFSSSGVTATLVCGQGQAQLNSPLLGRFNLSNLLAVVGTLLALGYSLEQAADVLPALKAPAGRMQRLGGGVAPLVVVDYAHTPDALSNALSAVRVHTQGRLLCLFGCGGDRDKGKRALMAEVAERLADQVWVTDDNPRSESAQAIQDDIRKGFKAPQQVRFIQGRGQAIAELVAQAGPEDVVVLAGKGHENYQEISGVRHVFSDIDQAMLALQTWELSHA